MGAGKMGMGLGGALGTTVGGGDPSALLSEVGDTLSYFMGRDAQKQDAATGQDYWQQRLGQTEQAMAKRPYTLSPGQTRMGPEGEIARGQKPVARPGAVAGGLPRGT
ncbi:unnamed protein product, partial [marine sediment metagenome]